MGCLQMNCRLVRIYEQSGFEQVDAFLPITELLMGSGTLHELFDFCLGVYPRAYALNLA
jgi:hypothetical protein